jgi:hypothetical protein
LYLKRSTLSSERFQIFPGFTVNHAPPVNLLEKDQWVFQDFFTQTIPEFHYSRLSNARVYFKHITKQGQILKEYCSSHPVPLRDRLLIPFKRVGYKKKELDFALSLVTLFGDNFHHFLAEVVPLVIYGQKFFGEHVPMLVPAYYFKQPYIEPYLRLLKVNWVTFESREQVVVKDLIVFKNLSIAHFNPQLLDQIRLRLAPRTESPPWRKVFVSRAKARFRKVIEEESYYPLLKEKGFEILSLEDYPVQDQIRIFSETKFLVGMHGEGLTNMVFMPKGGKVMELRAKTEETHIYNIFYVMASACSHDYYYGLGQGTHQANKLSDLLLDSEHFTDQINKAFS